MRPLPIHQVQTPAALYGVTETETVYGGRTKTLNLVKTVWGDFRPKPPAREATSDGDSYQLQEAEFLTRSDEDLVCGGVLRIHDADWTILSIDTDAEGTVRLRIERVLA
jgi:hypothetical protein